MALVTGVTLPNNGDRIKVENYNDPIQKILAQLNGNLDSTNIASLSGSKISGGSLPISGMADDVAAGWFPSSDTLTYVSNNGNKEYVVTTPTDKTSKYSPGMRVKISRSGTTPSTCADLESSLSQYATKSSPSGVVFTDDFTCEAWVKLESYATQVIFSRTDGTNGWLFFLEADGRVTLSASNAANTNYRRVTSYLSLPLGTWVHVAATLDMSGFTSSTCKVFINGIDVPAQLLQSGTNPTTTIQAGPLQVGAANSVSFFDGKLEEVRLWSSVRSQTQIRDNMNIQLTGSEGMIALFQLDETSGTTFNDSTSNANHLTAQGGLTAGNADSPFNATEYGIITKVSYSSPNTTINIFTGTDYNLPNGALSNFAYSTYKVPYGFPAARSKWRAVSMSLAQLSQSVAGSTWTNPGGFQLSIPAGDWIVTWNAKIQSNPNVAAAVAVSSTVSTANNSEISRSNTIGGEIGSTTASLAVPVSKSFGLSLSTQTIYYLNILSSVAATVYFRGDNASVELFAECAYL